MAVKRDSKMKIDKKRLRLFPLVDNGAKSWNILKWYTTYFDYYGMNQSFLGVDNVNEGRFEGSTSDQESINIFYANKLIAVLFVHTASIYYSCLLGLVSYLR